MARVLLALFVMAVTAVTACPAVRGLPTPDGAVSDAATDALLPAAPPPRTLAPLAPLAVPWIDHWTLDGGIDVVATLPTGASERRPVMIGIHGAYDRNDWACSEWFGTVRGYAFVLCPRGTPTADGSAVWSSPAQIVDRADLALAELRRRFPDYVAAGPLLYGGWSQGATLAAAAVALRPGLYARVVLVEAGHTPLSAPQVVFDLQKARTERVVVACSTASCRKFADEMERATSARHLPFARVDVGLRGHVFDAALSRALGAQWGWLTADDPRWSSAPVSTRD